MKKRVVSSAETTLFYLHSAIILVAKVCLLNEDKASERIVYLCDSINDAKAKLMGFL
ncbi:hypothetical protein ACQKOF_07895 [Lysinibacillus sp. NPDC093190]|uniref:hypothetical protein n=1 Tax=Lysinibacillus sp. NPDC093190 TaxID=3390575 RepID=UPI003D04F16B